MLVLWLRPSRGVNFSLVRKNKHCLNHILQSETTHKTSYILYPKLQMEARQSPFILPSRLEAHTTPLPASIR